MEMAREPSCHDTFARGNRAIPVKTVLNILEEFAVLNDAKVRFRGSLHPTSEGRWRSLKDFYDRLMSHPPSREAPSPCSRLSDMIRRQLTHRGRLRVRSEMRIFFQFEKAYYSSRLVNLSRGGIFIGSSILLTRGTPMTLYLPNLGSSYSELFETRAEVVWATKGIPRAGLPRGMGIRFCEMTPSTAEQLDDFIIESLRKRLV